VLARLLGRRWPLAVLRLVGIGTGSRIHLTPEWAAAIPTVSKLSQQPQLNLVL
jgi:hypothetical protein